MNNESKYAEASTLLECAELASDPVLKMHDLERVRSILNDQAQTDSDSAHLIGMSWYIDNVSADSLEMAQEWFSKALKLDKNNDWATVYSAHVLFDAEKYEEAFLAILRIPEEFLVSQQQDWRVVKFHELKLCCALYLNYSDEKINQLRDEYLCSMRKVTEVDRPNPTELEEYLRTHQERKSYIKNILGMIKD